MIVSAGRAQILAEALADLEDQTEPGIQRILVVPDAASLPDAALIPASWTVITGSRGAAVQRNTGIEASGDADIVLFFDDDSVVRPDYVTRAVDFFAERPDVVALTGRVLLDGATMAEVPRQTALDALRDSTAARPSGSWRRARELYGCNFAYRKSSVPNIRFDARLPLYSWMEDHDFARRLMRVGTLADVDDCVIVHRGAKSGGRTSHTRLGYSQVSNPLHFWRKGSFPAWLAMYEIFRPTSKNVLLSVTGRESEWRRERLRGNLMATRDLLRGRITPERIVELD